MKLANRNIRFADSTRLLTLFLQIAVFTTAGILAFLLRFDFVLTRKAVSQLMIAVPFWCVLQTLVFRILAIDRAWSRYFSIPDLLRIAHGEFVAFLIGTPIIWYLGPDGFPRSLYFLNAMVSCCGIAAIRSWPRFHAHQKRRDKNEGKRVVIYGAGQAGNTLLGEIRENPGLGYKVCGFVDDDPRKTGTSIQAVRVLGSGRDMTTLAERHTIAEILIAVPSADGSRMTQILEYCHASKVPCKTIPGLSEVLQSRQLMTQVRDVSVEDLLGRHSIQLDDQAICTKLGDAVVLVTGAGGSIGSELCRQIARFGPRAIVGYEIAESPLFEIDREMKHSFSSVPFYPEIGSIQNSRRFTEVLNRYSPSIVYHAAAYKHVPLMESHWFEAVENNVLGTRNVARLSAQFGVSSFVMISSDKAVRPTNIMGATKRVAELLINSLAGGATDFVSVRFGNVLGSNGSVIPIFKRQIAMGGPVTVTSPEMRRFFMTIPEAVQLVLQASTMGRSGDIFVFDMGEPVRIVDLARKLILLSGLKPGSDIEIQFTGVRPGEKLYEELSHLEEGTQPTYHDKIRIFSHGEATANNLDWSLDRLAVFCAERNARGLLLEIKNMIPEYNPSSTVLRTLLDEKSVPVLPIWASSNVTGAAANAVGAAS